MKYNSFVPPHFKRSLVFCLLNRCWRICSSYELFKQEYEFVKQLLVCNGFPVQFFNRQFKNFMSKKVNREGVSFLPYFGVNSIKLKRQLERLINAISPLENIALYLDTLLKLTTVLILQPPKF